MVGTESDDETSIVEGIIAFVDAVVVPLKVENEQLLRNPKLVYTETGKYSPEILALMRKVRMASASAGFYTAFCPTSIGGGGMSFRSMLLTYEAIYKRNGPHQIPFQSVIGHWATGPSFLCNSFTDELKSEILEDIVNGSLCMCFALSEADAGSDVWMMRTTAIEDGDEWVINGSKQWITGAGHADYAYLFAVTDLDTYRARKGGVSCFVVPMGARGVSVDSTITLFGEIGGNEGMLSFTDVRIPKKNLVGPLHGGFQLALGGTGLGRVYNSGRTLGLAQWCLAIARDHALSRKVFGKPLAEHQAISFKIADSVMEIFAARQTALELARRLDQGSSAVAELAIAKATCAETLLRVADRSMQICGAMGLTTEMELYQAWHAARILQLADGSAETARRTIAQRYLESKVEF